MMMKLDDVTTDNAKDIKIYLTGREQTFTQPNI